MKYGSPSFVAYHTLLDIVQRFAHGSKIEPSNIDYFLNTMPITLSEAMISRLSDECQVEIFQLLISSIAEAKTVNVGATVDPSLVPVGAFESASLSFGEKMSLVSDNSRYSKPVQDAVLPTTQIHKGTSLSIAKPSDLYVLASPEEIERIQRDIEAGILTSKTTSYNWARGGRFNPSNWDVKKVISEISRLQPVNSSGINNALPKMPTRRISEVLRELKKQGILVSS